METSKEYAVRCAEIINADKNISQEVILLMFIEYSNRVYCEQVKERK
jgi:hypothetical protein